MFLQEVRHSDLTIVAHKGEEALFVLRKILGSQGCKMCLFLYVNGKVLTVGKTRLDLLRLRTE